MFLWRKAEVVFALCVVVLLLGIGLPFEIGGTLQEAQFSTWLAPQGLVTLYSASPQRPPFMITSALTCLCNQMVSEPFSCLLLTIFNKRLLFRWILFRARQRVATSEQEMRAQSQYGQLPLWFLGRNPGLMINRRANNKQPVPNA